MGTTVIKITVRRCHLLSLQLKRQIYDHNYSRISLRNFDKEAFVFDPQDYEEQSLLVLKAQ